MESLAMLNPQNLFSMVHFQVTLWNLNWQTDYIILAVIRFYEAASFRSSWAAAFVFISGAWSCFQRIGSGQREVWETHIELG